MGGRQPTAQQRRRLIPESQSKSPSGRDRPDRRRIVLTGAAVLGVAALPSDDGDYRLRYRSSPFRTTSCLPSAKAAANATRSSPSRT
jgi:hypothetical protein